MHPNERSVKYIKAASYAASLFVAGYLCIAGMAPGGWHLTEDGEPTYRTPVKHSREFYRGLRYSVTIVGAGLAGYSIYKSHRVLIAVFTFIVVLFNPVAAIHLAKDTWCFIDLVCMWVFFIGPGLLFDERD
jgi:hypothetical protein